jgi:LemA protein
MQRPRRPFRERCRTEDHHVGNKSVLGCLGLVILIALIAGISAISTYNNLVTLDQAAQSQWGNVQSAYQRRADLVPNLVATVKGVANFEKSTYIAVAEARSKVGQVTAGGTQSIPTDPQAFAQFQKAQDGLTSALSRLLVVVERYPDLKANQNFLDLQSQLEGTENRIAVERMRYNDAAQAFNTTRQSFPTVIFANFFGPRFNEKPYFQSQPGAETAPKVGF